MIKKANDSQQVDVLPVVVETATARVESVEGQTVRVRRAVTTDTVPTDIELHGSTVEVTRHPVDRVVETPPDIRTEGEVTIIPVLEEVVETRTVLRLVEEVHVRRVNAVRTETHDLETRRHDVEVERTAPDGRTPQPPSPMEKP